MTIDLNGHKVPIFPNINDTPVAPTATKGGNASHLVSLYNGLIDDVQSALNSQSSTSLGLSIIPADTTYYVSPTGSDTNSGTSDTTPFKTIQKAIDTASGFIIPSDINITINIAVGTYTQSTVLKPFLGGGGVMLMGDLSNPANVNITTTDNSCFSGYFAAGRYILFGMKLKTVNSGSGIVLNEYGNVAIYNIEFNSTAENHISLDGRAVTFKSSGHKITGRANSHLVLANGAIAPIIGNVDIPSSYNFTDSFIKLSYHSLLRFYSTITGAIGGKRFSIASNSILQSSTNTLPFIPGTIEGTSESGGLYLNADGSVA